MITKEQFEELGLSEMKEFNGYDSKFYRSLAYKMYIDKLFCEKMFGYVHEEYKNEEEVIEKYRQRVEKYWKGLDIEEGMLQQLNKDFSKQFVYGHNEVIIRLQDFDSLFNSRGYNIMYSTVNGYMVLFCLRSLRFQGYITSIEDFKTLMKWLKLDYFKDEQEKSHE